VHASKREAHARSMPGSRPALQLNRLHHRRAAPAARRCPRPPCHASLGLTISVFRLSTSSLSPLCPAPSLPQPLRRSAPAGGPGNARRGGLAANERSPESAAADTSLNRYQNVFWLAGVAEGAPEQALLARAKCQLDAATVDAGTTSLLRDTWYVNDILGSSWSSTPGARQVLRPGARRPPWRPLVTSVCVLRH
jgi:hypothetical protein